MPTRDEAGNVEELVDRLDRALGPGDYAAIFVDDSDDETPQVVEEVGRGRADITLLHRPPGERDGGLGGAVVAGIAATSSPWVVVMDADLQHPPEVVPHLLSAAQESEADVVVASRYRDGGSAGFGFLRAAVSKASTLAAHVAFPRRLRGVTDPMSGFFLVRKDAVDLGRLHPKGFKILLEILARTPRLKVAEVPFAFGSRFAGQSKASLKEGLTYGASLVELRLGRLAARFSRFALVGASGLVVNALAFAVLLAGGLHYLLAALLATQVSTLWNFVLDDRWVFADRRHARSRSMRALLYFGLNNAALVVRGPILVLLVSGLAAEPNFANVLSLILLTVLRFSISDSWIWSAAEERVATRFAYDIHGLVSVESDVRLRELERFRVEGLGHRPTIRVHVGRPRRQEMHERVEALGSNRRQIRYDEWLGRFGFGVDIAIGRRVDVFAARLLAHSPHVLYTNVVEPILRWEFVRRGYALVHAACIAFDEGALLITARTDTGKTTTILKVLDQHECSFVSDDLVLLSRRGKVLSYPKPLTVSSHTVEAVRTPLLSRRERLTLPLQSRIHSRSGRRFAQLIARLHLPAATINTYVQMLVPPPKYDIGRLVPHAPLRDSALVSGLVVIERYGNGRVTLDADEAVETLLANCEDAFGFPPYPTIAPSLHGEGDQDLRNVERAIVTSALAGTPATVIRSEKRDWWQRLPAAQEAGSVLPEVAPVGPALAE